MCFLWQSNELLIFLLLGVSTPPLEFWSAVFSQNTAGLFFFSSSICFPLSFPLEIFLFMFLYSMHILSPFPPQTLLWPCAVYPCMPCTHPCCLFSLCIHFSPSVFSASATSYPLQWCSQPCHFSCSGFFLNLHSHLYLSPLPLATSPLKSFHSPFTSFPSLPLLCL